MALRGLTARVTVAATLVAAAVLLPAAVAHGAGPAAFSNPLPADGGFTVSRSTGLEVAVSDPAGISSGSLSVNGTNLASSYLDYPIGHWEDPDGCGAYWVVDDYTQAILRGSPLGPNLPVGTNTVVATVRNGASVVSTYTWSYEVDTPPVVATVTPTDGGVVQSLTPAVQGSIADVDSAFAAIMTFDGAVVVPSYDAGTKTFTYVPATPLQDYTQHFVSLWVQDSRGSTTTRSWSFTVVNDGSGAPVGFSGYSPADGSVVTVADVPISVAVDNVVNSFSASNPTGNPASKIYLDGDVLPTTADFPVGYWDGDPDCGAAWVVTDPTVMTLHASAAAVPDGPHTVRAEVTDDLGLTASNQWDFTVASPPSASAFSPTSGTSDTTPEIRARIADNGGTPTVVMRLDGDVVPASFDSGSGLLSYTPPTPISDAATHTVTLEMSDASGNSSTDGWEFRVQSSAAVTWSGWTPGRDTTTASNAMYVSATAQSATDLVRASSKVYLDGVAKTPLVYGATNTNLQVRGWSGPAPLGDGPHDVRVEVTDIYGISSETTWTFTVAVPPTVSQPIPVHLSTVNVPRPTIGFTIADNMLGPLNVRLTVDGSVKFDEPRPQGDVRWTPPTDFANNSSHTVVALVTDARGTSRTLTWNFTVTAAPAMSDADDCGACHTTYVQNHPTDNCGACHSTGDDPSGNHDIVGDPAPAGPCLGCHGWNHGPGYVAGRSCVSCHSSTWPAVPRHEAAVTDPLHDTTSTGCDGCHDVSLITEHGKYPTSGPFKNQCATCHTSTDSRVQAAILNGETACDACHTVSVSHEAVHDSTLSEDCTECHQSNISAQHGGLCDVCHTSTDQVVIDAIESGDKACSACHGTADHATQHVSVTNSSCFGAGCHDASKNLITVHELYAGGGSENPQFGNQCELCHDNPSVNTSTATTACTGACHAPPPHEGRAAGHALTAASSDCTGCHGSSIEEVHGAFDDLTRCGWCHDDPSTWSKTADCTQCHQPHGSFFADYYNPNFRGYLSWAAVSSAPGNQGQGGPHGNYTTTTTKCAVCHGTHRAAADGSVLTPWAGIAGGSSGENLAYGSCIFCHGPSTTFTDTRIVLGPGTAESPAGTLTPHSSCARCHTPSPHGAGASEFGALAGKLLNTLADAAIQTDIDRGANGVTAATFETTSAASSPGLVLGTGYLCTACHSTAPDPLVFAVNTPNARPTVAGFENDPAFVGSTVSRVTGHRVNATATATWNEDGAYGGFYSGVTDADGDSRVAFNPANSCRSCHDATDPSGRAAFPHGYVSADPPNNAVSSADDPKASHLWMTSAADADDTATVIPHGTGDVSQTQLDGRCLKCHLSADRSEGVGVTY